MGRGSLRKQKRRGEERRVYLASARHKGRSVEEKKKEWGVADRKDQQRGKAFQEGIRPFGVFFCRAERGNEGQ